MRQHPSTVLPSRKGIHTTLRSMSYSRIEKYGRIAVSPSPVINRVCPKRETGRRRRVFVVSSYPLTAYGSNTASSGLRGIVWGRRNAPFFTENTDRSIVKSGIAGSCPGRRAFTCSRTVSTSNRNDGVCGEFGSTSMVFFAGSVVTDRVPDCGHGCLSICVGGCVLRASRRRRALSNNPCVPSVAGLLIYSYNISYGDRVPRRAVYIRRNVRSWQTLRSSLRARLREAGPYSSTQIVIRS